MKKVILFAAVVSAFSFASCKKDHTCTCTVSPGTSAAEITTFPSSTNAAATANCLSYTEVVSTVTVTHTCTLK